MLFLEDNPSESLHICSISLHICTLNYCTSCSNSMHKCTLNHCTFALWIKVHNTLNQCTFALWINTHMQYESLHICTLNHCTYAKKDNLFGNIVIYTNYWLYNPAKVYAVHITNKIFHIAVSPIDICPGLPLLFFLKTGHHISVYTNNLMKQHYFYS